MHVPAFEYLNFIFIASMDLISQICECSLHIFISSDTHSLLQPYKFIILVSCPRGEVGDGLKSKIQMQISISNIYLISLSEFFSY